jgi:copper chaperone
MLQQFQVKGMSCGHCVRAVTQAVQSVDPKAEVKVDLNQSKVEIQSETPREALAKAIADQGYAVAA